MNPGPELRAEVERDLAALARSRLLRFVAVLALVAVGAGLLAWRGAAVTSGRFWLIGGGLALACVAPLAAVFGLPVAGTRAVWGVLAAAIGLGLAAVGAWIAPAEVGSGLGSCLPTGLGLGLGLGLATVLIGGAKLRRHVPTALLIGVAVGAAALLSLHVHCPRRDAFHLLAAHAPVLLALPAMLWLGWRRR